MADIKEPNMTKAADAAYIRALAADGSSILISKDDLTKAMFPLLRNLIKIGGTNLILETSREAQGQNGDNYFVRNYYMSEPPRNGETYTLSFEDMQLPNDNEGYGCNIYLWGGTWDNSIGIGNNIQPGSQAIIFTVGQLLSDFYSLRFYRPNIAGFSVRKVKLERGNIPTDWSPAPED